LYDKVLDNVKAPKLKVGDIVRGSRVKGLFNTGYLTNYWVSIPLLNLKWLHIWYEGEMIKGSFYDQEFRKTVQEVFRIEKKLDR
jgi:hypothetical protein